MEEVRHKYIEHLRRAQMTNYASEQCSCATTRDRRRSSLLASCVLERVLLGEADITHLVAWAQVSLSRAALSNVEIVVVDWPRSEER